MKKTALLAAAAAAMLATPAMAEGYLGLGYQDSRGGNGFQDGDGWYGEGAWGHSGAGWGGQIDGSFGSIDFGAGDEGDLWALTGHVFYSADSWRLGGVLGTSNADFGGGADFEETFYGVEGTYNMAPNAVLSGSATFGDFDFFFGSADTWNVDAALNFYATDNLRFGFNLGTGNIDAGGGLDDSSTTYGLNGEWKAASWPVSFGVDYTHYEEDVATSERDVLLAAVRWNFGESLRSRDNGTPFNTRGNLQRHYGIQ